MKIKPSFFTRPFIILVLFSFAGGLSLAQNPLSLSQSKIFGGDMKDEASAIGISADQMHLLIGGRSFSDDIYLPGNNGDSDFWIMKTSLEGDTIWSKNYGGTSLDDLNAILPMPDGTTYGFGTSYSDLEEFGTLQGLFGAWLMRVDTAGEIIFGNMIGGEIGERGTDLIQVSDDNLILVGESASSELGGAQNHGTIDAFVTRVSTAGFVIWTKLLGGTDTDIASSVKVAPGAGIIVAGSSNSQNGDIDSTRGGLDFWVVKILPNAQVGWSKTYGGSANDIANDIWATSDGGFLVVGETSSEDGDLGSPSMGGEDVWILKLDADGEIIWEKRYGGPANDRGVNISEMADGTFIIQAESRSNSGDLTGNNGLEDVWIFRINTQGNIVSQMNYGGSAKELVGDVVSTGTEAYIVNTTLSTDGNIPFPNYELEDLWLTTFSIDTVPCSENYICRQDTVIDINIIYPISDMSVTCINACNSALGPVPEFSDFDCLPVLHDAAIIGIYTDENAEFMTLSVSTEEFNLPYIALTKTLNCQNYTVVECDFGGSGNVVIENIPVEPNTLYMAIVSDLEGNVGEFNFCASVIDVEFCNVESSFEVISTDMGSPLNGPYLPGENVSICYEISNWEKLDCNGLQGLVPGFGVGWDSTNFNSFGMPIQIDSMIQNIAGGDWSWHILGDVRYNTFNPFTGIMGGTGMPAGWYFTNTDGPPPNEGPDDTEGDLIDCQTDDSMWKICFTLQTVSQCVDNLDCSVTMKSYADGELGVNTSLACGYDPVVKFNAFLSCCINPNMDNIPDLLRCSGDTISFGFDTNIPGNVTFTWSVTADEGIVGENIGSGSSFSQVLHNIEPDIQTATYTVVASAEFCEAPPITFDINVRPVPQTQMALVGPAVVCSGEEIQLQFTNTGQPPYFIQFAANNILQDTFLAEGAVSSVFLVPEINTQYIAADFADANCSGEAGGVVNVIVHPAPQSVINTVICEGDSFYIGDIPFTLAGAYEAVIPGASVNGCDSTVNLILSVAPVQETPLDTFICQGEVLFLGGLEFFESGQYEVPLLNQFDCDSIILLNLTVDTVHIIESMQTICAGNSVTFNGVQYSETGIYSDTFPISEDCDRIETLNLNVLPEIFINTLSILSDNGTGTGAVLLDIQGGMPPYTYLWNDGATTESNTDLAKGDYSINIMDAFGCEKNFSFSVPLGTYTSEEKAVEKSIRLFPNPVRSGTDFWLEIGNRSSYELNSLEVLDLNGKVIWTDYAITNQQLIKMSISATPSMYLVRINLEGLVVYRKIIIQN